MTPKALIATLIAAACATTAHARTAAEVFAEAPASVIPALSQNTRLDMLDYFRSGLPTPSANNLDGRSRITALADDAVDISIGRDSSMQFVLLPGRSDTIAAIVETVLTPVADSSIRYYRTNDWTAVAGPAMPGEYEFVDPRKRKEAAKADMPPFMFVRAEYKPDTRTFIFTNTTPAYYTDNDRPDGLALMRSVLSMKYTPKRFAETDR